MWISIIGDDSLTCKREEHNENDKSAVAIIWDDCVSKKIVGHVPLNWSKVASKFLQLKNHHIRVELTGMRLDWDSKYLQTIFFGDARVITWVKNSLGKLDNEFHVKVKKCVK